MCNEWWDTEAYRKRFVPYHTMLVLRLYDWLRLCPVENMTRFLNLVLSWYHLGEMLDREYRFRCDNGYDTAEIEEAVRFYTDCSASLAERIDGGACVERLVPSVEP